MSDCCCGHKQHHCCPKCHHEFPHQCHKCHHKCDFGCHECPKCWSHIPKECICPICSHRFED